jgi:class 6 POU domain transcription factor
MQQFLIPSSTGSPQIINIPVSLLSQNNQQPVSLITANGQIFQLPVSQLVVHQNSDGSTTTTTTTPGPASSNVASNSASVSNTASSSSPSSSSTNSSAPNSNAQLVINHQGQLISLPVIQAATAGQSNQTAAFTNNGSLQTVNFVSLAGSNNVQLHAINRNQGSSTTNSNNAQAPIKSLLDDEDKSDNDDQGQTIAQMPLTSQMTSNGSITHGTTVDGVNLDEIREFAKAFKLRRLALGLTQTQVGQALSATKGPAYSQSAICRFEKLDITPKSAAKIKPVLEKWMQEAELKYADRYLK